MSDNGSNFIGTRNELLKVQELLNREKQENFINNQGIEWVTIPTKAPHFGGLWEATVKSMKRHMRRVIGLQVLNYEELVTIIIQIEAVLNSRPLYPMSNDPTDLSPLTPGHFLIGSPLLSLPERETDDATPLPIRIQLIKKIQDDFWKRWKRDYLVTLQIRKKWFSTGPDMRIGDLALLAEDNQAPLVENRTYPRNIPW